MIDIVGILEFGLTSPYALLPEAPTAIAAHGVAAALAYRQHRADWPTMGAKYFLLATVGTVLTWGSKLVIVQDTLSSATMAAGLDVAAAAVFSIPALGIYVVVRRGGLRFLDAPIERVMTVVVTRIEAFRDRRAERFAARLAQEPAAAKPARPRKVNGTVVTVRNADGEWETIIINSNAMSLPAKIHLWASIAKHAAIAAAALIALMSLPAWLRPIAEGGAAVGMMGGFHLLHFVPHFFGL